jgi:hypothetical protein
MTTLVVLALSFVPLVARWKGQQAEKKVGRYFTRYLWKCRCGCNRESPSPSITTFTAAVY